jgi:hypothetical protein
VECYYCHKNEALPRKVVSPHTRKSHPTCEVCEFYFFLVKRDIKRYSSLRGLGNLLIISSSIGFFLKGWEVGLALVFIGFSLRFNFHIKMGKNSESRNHETFDFARRKGLRPIHSSDGTT